MLPEQSQLCAAGWTSCHTCSCRYHGTWLSRCCGPGGKLSVNARIELCAIARSAAAAAAAAWPEVMDRLRSNGSSAPASIPPPLRRRHPERVTSWRWILVVRQVVNRDLAFKRIAAAEEEEWQKTRALH